MFERFDRVEARINCLFDFLNKDAESKKEDIIQKTIVYGGMIAFFAVGFLVIEG